MANTLQVSCIQLHWAKSLKFNLDRTLHYIKATTDSGNRVVLFPEAKLTSYYLPYVIIDSMRNPPFLSRYRQNMIKEVKQGQTSSRSNK